MMADIRTKREKERDRKHLSICNDYKALIAYAPKSAPHRLFRVLAEKYGMTVPGIKNIIVSNGLYSTKTNN